MGRFDSAPGQSECDMCAPGLWKNETGAITGCNNCSVGQYQPSRAQTKCKACPRGTFQNKEGSQFCQTCNSGKIAPFDQTVECESCAAGKYQGESGKANCADCETGRSSNKTSSTECDECDRGTFSPVSGMKNCFLCSRGQFALNKQATHCMKCPVGRSVNDTGYAQCEACEAGFFQNEEGKVECKCCSRGQFTGERKSTECNVCKVGQVTNRTNSIRCESCEAGFYQNEIGKTVCKNCPAGYAQEKVGRRVCTPCKKDTYASQSGEKVCKTCHTFSGTKNRTGSTSESACICDDGYHSVGEGCKPCPEHAVCKGGLAQTQKGYWRYENATKRYPCEDLSVCLQNDTCAENNRGPLCAACKEGTYKQVGAGICIACYDFVGLSYLIMVLVLIVSGGLLALVTKMTIAGSGKSSAVDVVIGKIAINHLIIVSSARLFPLKWPGFVNTFFSLMTIMSASAVGESGLSMSCIMRNHATMKPVQSWALVVTVLIPVLVATQVLFWKIRKYMKGAHISVMITLLLAHPTITKAAISLIACRKVASKAYLHADMNIECYTSEYNAWLGLALPMLIVYSVGIPLTYFLILRRHVSKDTLETKRDIYGYLTSGYNDETYWFELWNTVRKAMFSAFSLIFAPLGIPMQTWIAVMLLLLYISVFIYASPYTVEYLNDLEKLALAVDALTLLCGIGLFNNESNDEDRRSEVFSLTISLFVVGMNTVYMVWLFHVLYAHSDYREQILAFLCCRNSVENGEPVESTHGVEIANMVDNVMWKRHTTDDGRVYFENVSTRETRWEIPEGESESTE